MRRILLVDDEKQILQSLTRAFFETDYDIYTAGSGAEALELLQTQEVDLVISDMRMPFMDGYELLRQIKTKYPKVIRVIMSGYSEERTIIKALVRNIAKIYILKPWNNEKLLQYVEQLFVTEDILNSNQLLALINGIEEFPTLPESYQRILTLIQDEANMKIIADEIGKDFAISSKLLQVVNSAFFGVKTGSIHQVVVFLGLQNITSLILSTSIITASNDFHIDAQDYKLLWSHALHTNVILSFLYEKFLHKNLPETALSAGLLHNIGLVIADKLKITNFFAAIRRSHEEPVNVLDMELEELLVTHQEVGAYLLSWWELPFPIVEAALYHHRPFDPNIVHSELVASVHIAQKYAWELLGEKGLTPFYPEVFDLIEVSQAEFEQGLAEELGKVE